MANLRDIRKRITSVKNTQKITKAMKMVSAAKLKRYQERFQAIAACQNKLLSLIAKAGADFEHPLMAEGNGNKRLFVIISSDRGLCGAFNGQLIKFADATLRECKEDFDVYFVGRKAFEFLRRRNYSLAGQFDLKRAETGDIDELFKALEQWFLSGTYRSISIISSEFRSVLSQKPRLTTFLPIAINSEAVQGEAGTEYLLEPSKQRVGEALLSYYTYLSLYRQLAENMASEHGARMGAMESATKNAGEMIGRLTLTYNRTRQAAITKELIEIISGAESTK